MGARQATAPRCAGCPYYGNGRRSKFVTYCWEKIQRGDKCPLDSKSEAHERGGKVSEG